MSLLNLVAFVAFATSLFSRSTDPIVPQIADAFLVAPATAALLASAFALPYALVQPLLGALADMFSKTRLMTGCLLILVIASSIAVFAPNFETMVAMRAISGVASGGVFPIVLALAGDRVPVAERQVAISRLLAAAMAGNLLGASGAGVLADLFGWRSVFVATAVVGFVIFVAAMRGFRNVEDTAPGRFDLSTIGPNYRTIFRNPLAKYCFGAVFVESLCVFGLFPHIANLMQQGGETLATAAGIVLAGFGFGAILYTLIVSRLLGWFEARTMMLIGGAVMRIVPHRRLATAGVALRTGEFHPARLRHVFAARVHPDRRDRTRARGTRIGDGDPFRVFFFGQAAGPYLYGRGFATLGVSTTILLAAALMAATAIVASIKMWPPSAEPKS